MQYTIQHSAIEIQLALAWTGCILCHSSTSAVVAFLVVRGAGAAAGAPGEAAAADEGGGAILVGSRAALEAMSTCTRTNGIFQALP